MCDKIRSIFLKYRELICYVFFGGLTTVVSFSGYFFLNGMLKLHYLAAQIISWIIAVAFAFVTNKRYVFDDNNSEKTAIIKQIIQFYGARLFSFAVETALLALMVDLLSCGEGVSKLIVSLVTIVLNYVTSKLFVFREKRSKSDIC